MTAGILAAAKDLSIWVVAIIGVYFLAELVLKEKEGHAPDKGAAPTRLSYVRLGAGIIFCLIPCRSCDIINDTTSCGLGSA